MATKTTKRKNRPGVRTLFPGKIRRPLTFTATKAVTQKLTRASRRLKISRADVIGLLADRYADRDPLA